MRTEDIFVTRIISELQVRFCASKPRLIPNSFPTDPFMAVSDADVCFVYVVSYVVFVL